jgi:hypothetical protein
MVSLKKSFETEADDALARGLQAPGGRNLSEYAISAENEV